MSIPLINLGDVDMTLLAQNLGGSLSTEGKNVSVIFACDENSCVYFADNGLASTDINDLNIFVIDASGAITWYQANSSGTDHYVENITPFGNGNFLISLSNNQTFFAHVANLKLNNASPILIRQSDVPFTNSCYDENLQGVFYDSVQKLIIAYWYESAGQYGTEVFSSVYRVGNNGILTKLNDGYTGYFCNGCDPPVANSFNQFASSLPPSCPPFNTELNSQGTLSNGLNASMFSLISCSAQSMSSFGGYSPKINYGATGSDCSESNNNSVGVRASFYYETSYAYGTVPMVDSTIPGMCGINLGGGAPVIMADGIKAYEFLPLYNGAYLNYNGLLTKNYFFTLGKTVVGGVSVPSVFIAPNPGIQRSGVAFRNAYTTVNSSRPISITGAYKS